MNFKLTQRDLALMRWINDHGFVTIHHIANFMKTTIPCAYARVKCLVDCRYLRHNRIFHGAPGIYRTTLSGVHVSSSGLPPMRHVPLATYQHDLYMVEVSLLLLNTLGGTFITERLLRQDAGISRFNHGIHLSDGLLKLDNKTIAIEIELSKKTKARRDGIIQHYMAKSNISEVWYFCGDSAIQRNVEKSTEAIDFVQCFLLEKVLENNHLIKEHVNG